MTNLVPHNDLAIQRFGNGDERKLKAYLVMLTAFLGGHSENTRRTYKVGIRQFFELFEWLSPENVTPAHAAAFKEWLLKHRGVAESTAYYRMSAVSSFFDYLCNPPDAVSDPLIRSNPFKLVPRNDIQPTPYAKAKPMKWEDFQAMINTTPSDVMGMRDKAMLLFFAFTGRRRAEVANLRVRDLDLTSRPRTYSCKLKGGRFATFELPDVCYDAIQAYWIISDRLADLTADSAVFAACRTTPMNQDLDPDVPLSVRTINDILRRCAVRAGLDPDDDSIGLHAMRHMTASDLDKAGVRLQDIQEFLGHASPKTTQIYIHRLGKPAGAHTEALMRVRLEAEKLAAAVVDG